MDCPAKFLLSRASLCVLCPCLSQRRIGICSISCKIPITSMEDSSVGVQGLLGLFSKASQLDFTFLFLSGELQKRWPFCSSRSSQHNGSVSGKYSVKGILLTCWAYQLASVFQHLLGHVPCSRQCLYIPRRSALCAVLSLLNQNKPIYTVSSREQDLLPALVICTNCSPEILISAGNSPAEPGTQRNIQLSLLHLSHLNISD